MSLKWPVALVLLIIPLGVMLFRRFRKIRPQPAFIAESASLNALPSYKKSRQRSVRMQRFERAAQVVLLISILLIIARPQAALTSYNQEKSRDTVLCLDVSGSMKEYIPIALDTLERIYKQNPTDRYGIVVFAGRAAPVLPLTRDQVAIQQKIDMLREVYVKDNDPNYQFQNLVGYGTDIGEGVLVSVQRFDDLKTYKTRNIILVSDLDQTGGDYDPDGQKYLEKVGLVPKNRINMFILQTPLEYSYATSPQQIISTSGAQTFKIDTTDTKGSAQSLLNQIFTQVLNTRMVTGKNQADYPYIVMAGVLVVAAAWSIVVAIRWRHV